MSKIQLFEMILGKLFQNISINNKLIIIYSAFIIAVWFNSYNFADAQLISYPKHQIGIGYSSFSGAGITYQIEMNRSHSLQFSALPIYLSDGPDNLDINVFLGGEYQLTIKRFEKSRIYTFAGIGLTHLENRLTTKTIINDAEIKTTKIDLNQILNYGIGIAVEYKFAPRIAVSSGIGLLYQTSAKGNYSEFWDRNPQGDTYLGVGAALSIRYIF